MRQSSPLLPHLYYLRNFRTALRWLSDRYGDLLAPVENDFILSFDSLPWQSQALLVRLIMRKGPFFRSSRICYGDIGDIAYAARFLIELGWIDAHPLLSQETLLGLITVSEAKALFPDLPKTCTKAQLRQMVVSSLAEPRTFEEWRCDVSEGIFLLSIAPICTRLRLLFFGNFSQDWSEFVLADLGIFKYETVPLSNESRAFGSRIDIEVFFSLYECRCQLDRENTDLDEVLAQLPSRIELDWLEARRAELMFCIAREYERSGKLESALELYGECRYPGARLRAIRTLENLSRYEEAQARAEAAIAAPESEEESQRLPRVMRRLARHTRTLPPVAVHFAPPPRLDLIVPAPMSGQAVEMVVSRLLATEHAPVYYVENTLIKALFGLHFWDAIFAPVSGAFFHPFHTGPADLYSRGFFEKRAALFEQGFERLDNADYVPEIKNMFRAKQDIQSPFVSWRNLSLGLLNTALECIPALHLRLYFTRLLSNLQENRNGLPDLVQFWPREKSYRMIEVKGPGDRLQDNQLRWAQFCLEHQMPVVVCHVRWLASELDAA
jgi:tetratricopeptide (TPR) repeat protein